MDLVVIERPASSAASNSAFRITSARGTSGGRTATDAIPAPTTASLPRRSGWLFFSAAAVRLVHSCRVSLSGGWGCAGAWWTGRRPSRVTQNRSLPSFPSVGRGTESRSRRSRLFRQCPSEGTGTSCSRQSFSAFGSSSGSGPQPGLSALTTRRHRAPAASSRYEWTCGPPASGFTRVAI